MVCGTRRLVKRIAYIFLINKPQITMFSFQKKTMNLFDRYKVLQLESESILVALKEELDRIISLNPIEAKCKVENEVHTLHNALFAKDSTSVNLLMGVQSKLGIYFYTFETDIPFSLFFKSDDIVRNYWKNHDRVRYFQKKFTK